MTNGNTTYTAESQLTRSGGVDDLSKLDSTRKFSNVVYELSVNIHARSSKLYYILCSYHIKNVRIITRINTGKQKDKFRRKTILNCRSLDLQYMIENATIKALAAAVEGFTRPDSPSKYTRNTSSRPDLSIDLSRAGAADQKSVPTAVGRGHVGNSAYIREYNIHVAFTAGVVARATDKSLWRNNALTIHTLCVCGVTDNVVTILERS